MAGMRKFLFQNLYKRDDISERMERGKNLIKKLYEYYNEKLAESYIDENEKECAVVDYISGMTDSFAVKKFKEIFLP